MITAEQHCEIQRLTEDLVSCQIALTFNPEDEQTISENAAAVKAFTDCLNSLTEE